jgi:Ca2+-binding RTX toxin-like protein
MVRLCTALVVFVAALAGAGSAGAATVSADEDGSDLSYVAAPGESNHVRIVMQGSSWTVTETGAPLAVGPNCVLTGAQTAACIRFEAFGGVGVNGSPDDGNDWASVICPPAEFVGGCALQIDGGEGADTLSGIFDEVGGGAILGGGGDDVVRSGPWGPARGGEGDDLLVGRHLDGGPGADTLVGEDEFGLGAEVDYSARVHPVFVSLNGRRDDGEQGENDLVVEIRHVRTGSGDDVIVGDSGDNIIEPGPGNDVVYTGAGTDTVDADATGCFRDGSGPGGADRIYGQSGTDFLDGCGGNDTVYGGLGYDILWGTGGSDRLFGIDQGDTIVGGFGNDTIGGGRGEDDLRGQEGNDTFYARDRQADRIVGWTGFDRARIDRGLDRRSSIERLF